MGGFIIAIIALAVGGKAGVIPACTMYGAIATAYMGSNALQNKPKG